MPDDCIVFGYIGQISPVKGLSHLFDALAGMLHMSGWRIAVAGRDPSPGACYEMKCRDQAIRLRLDERVTFLGFLHDVRPFYEAVDVVVLPSLEEPLARVVYEAAGHAKPIIAYATGGLPEAIRPGETGWLVPSGDIVSLREQLHAFLERPVPDVGLAARAWVESVADPRIYAAKVVALYHRLLL
jgi:glycosyltransferase involved in cell wall biosynthesis